MWPSDPTFWRRRPAPAGAARHPRRLFEFMYRGEKGMAVKSFGTYAARLSMEQAEGFLLRLRLLPYDALTTSYVKWSAPTNSDH